MIEQKDLDEIIRTAMRVKAENGAEAHHRHYCWQKRLVIVGVIVGGLMYASHLLHVEELSRGWEFVAACVVDKVIFGIAEVA